MRITRFSTGFFILAILVSISAPLTLCKQNSLLPAILSKSGQQKSPLSLNQVEALIKIPTPDNAIAIEIRQRGIDFELDASILEKLRKLGAGPKTMEALRGKSVNRGGSISNPPLDAQVEVKPPPPLPSSSPTMRALVDQSIKEIVVKGGMDLSDLNSMVVWRKLHQELQGKEIPELCQILGEAHEWDVRIRAIILLSYSASQLEAEQFQSSILAVACNHIASGGHVQEVALKMIRKLHVKRIEIWKCLFDSLRAVNSTWAASGIVKMISQFTPPEHRDQTASLILELFTLLEEDVYTHNLIKAIEELDYRKSIPTLRQMFSSSYHSKIVYSAELLAKWQDKDSITYMRQYIEANYSGPSSYAYLDVLRALYQIEGSSCASYIAKILLNSSVQNQRRFGYYGLRDFKDEPVVIDALRKLLETTTDSEVKKSVSVWFKK